MDNETVVVSEPLHDDAGRRAVLHKKISFQQFFVSLNSSLSVSYSLKGKLRSIRIKQRDSHLEHVLEHVRWIASSLAAPVAAVPAHHSLLRSSGRTLNGLSRVSLFCDTLSSTGHLE